MRRLDLRQTRHELRQAVFDAEILAVRRGVLADQIDLANALREQARRFHDHRLEAPAAELAAILRDHAERAGMVAALGDLDVGVMARGGQNARRQVVIEIRLERVRRPASRPRTARRSFPARWCRAPRPLPECPCGCRRDSAPPGIRRRSAAARGPDFLYSAISRIVSTDSCLAGSMKLQVFTTRTSASLRIVRESHGRVPTSWPIMTSVSTRFFGQPRLTKPIFKVVDPRRSAETPG